MFSRNMSVECMSVVAPFCNQPVYRGMSALDVSGDITAYAADDMARQDAAKLVQEMTRLYDHLVPDVDHATLVWALRGYLRGALWQFYASAETGLLHDPLPADRTAALDAALAGLPFYDIVRAAMQPAVT